MKRRRHATKWIILICWLIAPIILRQISPTFEFDSLYLPWYAASILLALGQFVWANYKLSSYLQNNYPTEYRMMVNRSKNVAKRHPVSSSLDMIFDFSPPNDNVYPSIKSDFETSLIFMFIMVIGSFWVVWKIA